MYRLEYPWLLALLPLPLLVYWLLPPYKEEQDSLRLTFFHYISSTPGSHSRTRRGRSQNKLAAENPRAHLLVPDHSCACAAAIRRAADSEDPAGARSDAGAGYFAVDGDARFPHSRRQAHAPRRRGQAGRSEFIRKRKNDRIGLIVFGQAAYPVTPFTLDHDACLKILSQTDAGMAGPQTMIGDAIGLAIKQFQNSEAKQRVLILLTDGNDTGSRMPPRKAAEIASQNGITIHVVGLGDPHATGEDKVDYAALNDIAKATGGQVFHGENRG